MADENVEEKERQDVTGEGGGKKKQNGHQGKRSVGTGQDAEREQSASHSDGVEKGKEIGREAYGKAKEATGHATSALKILIADPMGGQGEAMDLLGDQKALSAGIVFAIGFVVAAFLVVYSVFVSPMKQMAAQFGQTAGVGLGVYFKLLVSACIPPVVLAAGFLGISKIFGGKGNIFSCVFSAGVALLPSAVTLLAIWILGVGNIELAAVIAVFGVSITILLLNSALLDLQGLSTRKAVLLTPTLILVTGYVAKVLLAALLM